MDGLVESGAGSSAIAWVVSRVVLGVRSEVEGRDESEESEDSELRRDGIAAVDGVE